MEWKVSLRSILILNQFKSEDTYFQILHTKIFHKIEETLNWKTACKYKVNSVQEACAKFVAVHILKFEILQTTWKN